MTHRPSRRPAERATEREVGVVTAVVLAGSEEAAAQALSATPSVRSRKSLVWGEGMPTTDSASPGTRRYASSVTANTTDDSRRRRDASLMPQGMGAPADDAARMGPDRTPSPEGDSRSPSEEVLSSPIISGTTSHRHCLVGPHVHRAVGQQRDRFFDRLGLHATLLISEVDQLGAIHAVPAIGHFPGMISAAEPGGRRLLPIERRERDRPGLSRSGSGPPAHRCGTT